MNAEVWIIHGHREVLVTDLPGPPIDSTGRLVEFVGEYPLPEYGWGEAGAVAEARAKLLGYRVHRESLG